MNEFLKNLLPTVATALGGPFAGIATKFVADKLGVPASTTEAITTAISNAAMTPEGKIQLAQIEADLQKHFADLGIRQDELAVQNAQDINKTMQAEAASEHWPTYSWRPSIGFAIAINVVLTTLTVLVAYVGVMFFQKDAAVLSYIPAMIGAMAALLAAPSGIVGVASWFRGKMQADPGIPSVNRG